MKSDLSKSDSALLRLQSDLEEIERVSLRQGEDESLSSEHFRLTHAERLAEQLFHIDQALNRETFPLAKELRKISCLLEQQFSFDASLKEAARTPPHSLDRNP